jgi:DNA mismatch repair protein MutS2
MPENLFSLATLEFDKVLAVIRRHLRTPLSPALLESSRPTQDVPWLAGRFGEIDSAMRLLEHGGSLPFEGIHDIRGLLRQASLPGAFCEGIELYRVLETLRGMRTLGNSLQSRDLPLGALQSYAYRFMDLTDLLTRFGECLESDGSLKDSASPALRRIREQIKRQRAHIQKRLEEMCRSSHIRPLLQEEYFTERRGRYVLPVQTKEKRRIRGIQHGRSDSGTTAYIEPFELVEAGNQLAENLEEEGHEVVRILRELTRTLAASAASVSSNLDTTAELDLVVSLAEYGLAIRTSLPRIAAEGDLVLNSIRHPLLLAQLPHEEVVPNDIRFSNHHSGILITGPNTGGKTVVLKTVGLSCALALSGLPIPCGPETVVPVLGGVLADIGDDQSIEESLSTFSSHVSRMKSFLDASRELAERNAPRPLVLLDELGAGTDPTEGDALGKSALEELMELGAWVLVATHLGGLKLFAHGDPRLVSAAMRFDTETLSPTYELIMDTVGESHGIEIAQRLGIPEAIIEKARALIESDPNRSTVLLHRLTEEERRARELREQMESLKLEIEEKKNLLVERIEETARNEQRILNRARSEAETKIASAKKKVARLEEIIAKEEEKLRKGYSGREEALNKREEKVTWMEKELEDRLSLLIDLARKFPNFAPDPLREDNLRKLRLQNLGEPEWKLVLRQINQEQENLARDFAKSKPSAKVSEEDKPVWEEVESGDRLKVEGLEQPVVVKAKDERKKRLSILVGNLTSEIPFSRVLRRLGAEAPAAATAEFSPAAKPAAFYRANIEGELNLIGKTLEEMTPELRKYLDDAALSGWDEVRVIHGFGTGVLRRGVRQVLEEHPSVVGYRDGEAGEGGLGATVARIRH